jgi:hypothetical protein
VDVLGLLNENAELKVIIEDLRKGLLESLRLRVAI